MTVQELLRVLQKWADQSVSDNEVRITADVGPIGASSTHRIVSVSGVAGARIDGADSCVMIFYHPYQICEKHIIDMCHD